MSVSTDAIIAFGIQLDEYVPWDDYEFEDWWLENTGYDGISYEEKKKWLELHPINIEVVEHCCSEELMHIVAMPGTVTRAYRGYPKELTEELITKPSENKIKEFKDWVVKYLPEDSYKDIEPKWYLFSLWM